MRGGKNPQCLPCIMSEEGSRIKEKNLSQLIKEKNPLKEIYKYKGVGILDSFDHIIGLDHFSLFL